MRFGIRVRKVCMVRVRIRVRVMVWFREISKISYNHKTDLILERLVRLVITTKRLDVRKVSTISYNHKKT